MLGALLLAAIAIGFQFDIAELLVLDRNGYEAIQAASYTDINAQVPAYTILTVWRVVAALLLLANIWFRTLWLLGLTAAAWVADSILVGNLYRARPEPCRSTRTSRRSSGAVHRSTSAPPGRRSTSTRSTSERYTGEQALTQNVFANDATTIDNLRLWDYRPLLKTFGADSRSRQYYEFRDVDIDRYHIGGQQRQIMLTRESSRGRPSAAPGRTSGSSFTHGYGITAVPVNAVTPKGSRTTSVQRHQPASRSCRWRAADLLRRGDRHVVGRPKTTRVRLPARAAQTSAPPRLEGGRPGSGSATSSADALFALRFGDLNLLVSNQLTEQSQILFRRNIEERVQEIAPFLSYDRDPYLVSADGTALLDWDAYTTATVTPTLQRAARRLRRFGGENYVRNSVKVVIDAYDGTDALLRRRSETTRSSPPTHASTRTCSSRSTRCPRAAARTCATPRTCSRRRTQTYLLYHLPGPSGAARSTTGTTGGRCPRSVPGRPASRVEPYYVIMRLPGDQQAEFVLIAAAQCRRVGRT